MNSKRSSRKLWRLIDSFFLLFPLFVLVFVFIGFLLFYQKSGQLEVDNGMYYYVDILNDFIVKFFNDDIYINVVFSYLFENNFGATIYDATYDIFYFLGFDISNAFVDYFHNYFCYAIIYEFFSLIIQIILWLPRWAKNKLYEWGDN